MFVLSDAEIAEVTFLTNYLQNKSYQKSIFYVHLMPVCLLGDDIRKP